MQESCLLKLQLPRLAYLTSLDDSGNETKPHVTLRWCASTIIDSYTYASCITGHCDTEPRASVRRCPPHVGPTYLNRQLSNIALEPFGNAEFEGR